MQNTKLSVGLTAALAILAASLFTSAAPAAAQQETVIYSFNDVATDAYYPYGALISDASGNFYGTTSQGGSSACMANGSGTVIGCAGGGTYYYGAVYKLSPSSSGWTETALHSFDYYTKDGATPYAGLLLDSAGNLYGTTFAGGAHGPGSVFKIVP